MCVCVRAFACVRVCVCARVRVCACARVRVCACARVCAHVCVCGVDVQDEEQPAAAPANGSRKECPRHVMCDHVSAATLPAFYPGRAHAQAARSHGSNGRTLVFTTGRA